MDFCKGDACRALYGGRGDIGNRNTRSGLLWPRIPSLRASGEPVRSALSEFCTKKPGSDAGSGSGWHQFRVVPIRWLLPTDRAREIQVWMSSRARERVRVRTRFFRASFQGVHFRFTGATAVERLLMTHCQSRYVVPRGREGGNARDPAGYARSSVCRGVDEATASSTRSGTIMRSLRDPALALPPARAG